MRKDVDTMRDTGGVHKHKDLKKPSRKERPNKYYLQKDKDFKETKSDPDLKMASQLVSIARQILKYGLVVLTVLFVTGCNSSNKEIISMKRYDGIIDACYTVLQYNPSDKDERINRYLQNKQKDGQINQKEKVIIQKCLQRTQSSKRWSK